MWKNDRLYHLIGQLDREELLFLLRNGLGIKERKYGRCSHDQLKDIVSSELRHAASHNFATYFRLEHEFPYKQILIDVAERLSEGIPASEKRRFPSYTLDDGHDEEEIEKNILRLFEMKTKEWWKGLSAEEREQVADKITKAIDAQVVNSVNRWTLIKYRITKEIMDSIVTKGLIIAMLAISAGGVLGIIGGSLLSRIGWKLVVRTMGFAKSLKLLSGGIAGLSGIAILDIIGGVVAAVAVFVPSTIYYYADIDYKKTIPTIIMLLSKIHLNKAFMRSDG